MPQRFTVFAVILCLGVAASAYGQNPVPVIYQPLIPAAVSPGSAEFLLTVNGTGFVSGAVVRWNGTPLATTFVSSSRVTAEVPATEVAVAGTATVTVTNPNTGAASNAIFFPVATPGPAVYFTNAPGSPINLGGVDNTANEVMSMAEGDFNGDLKPDLALSVEEDHDPGFVMTFLGEGDGTFTQATQPSPPPLGQQPGSTVAGDFNGDGKADLAVANYGSNTVSVLLGNGDGTFARAPGSAIAVGANPAGLAVGDFNGDGKLDLAVANAKDNTVTVLLGNGDGTFTPAPGSPIALPGTAGAYALAVGDFNGDGKLDLAVATFDGHAVDILLGHGDGTFALASGSPISLQYVEADALAVGDFNGDGKLDLAVANGNNDTVSVLLGNGDGTFSAVPNCCGASNQVSHTFTMASGDFNDDGRQDLVLAVQNLSGSNPADYLQVLLGNGDGTFTPTDFSLLVPNDPYSMAVGDFNSDGKIDFATGSTPFQDLAVLLQTAAPSTLPDFNVSLTGSGVSVQPGATATENFQVSSVAGFTGPVSPSCSGVPADATCSVSPNFWPLVPTATGYGTVTITTTAPSASGSLARSSRITPWQRWSLGFWPAWLIALVALVAACRYRADVTTRRAPSATLAGVLALVLFSFACNGGSRPAPTPPPPTGGTPPGTYTIVVKAASSGTSAGSITHSASFTLDVE